LFQKAFGEMDSKVNKSHILRNITKSELENLVVQKSRMLNETYFKMDEENSKCD
jgi:hypothetical protein